MFLGKPTGPCIMGIILNTDQQMDSILNNELLVKVGTMPSITFNIHLNFFPVLFMITDIPVSQIGNSTLVAIRITTPSSIIAYEARERAVFCDVNECTTLLFKVAEESKNI